MDKFLDKKLPQLFGQMLLISASLTSINEAKYQCLVLIPPWLIMPNKRDEWLKDRPPGSKQYGEGKLHKTKGNHRRR